jgi:hypothetical protein
MATKTKTATKQTTATGAKVQIPSAVRPSANDLLNNLQSLVQPKPKADKKKDRPVLQLTPELEALFLDFVPAKVLEDHFKSNCETLKSQLKEQIFDLYLDLVWQAKTQPENPRLNCKNAAGSPDCEAMYVIQDKYKVQGQSVAEVVDALVSAGLQESDAKRLVENELDFTPSVKIDLGVLLKGTPEQKSVGERILGWVSGQTVDPLSKDEVAMAVTMGNQVEVKGDFICRACNYARKREDLTSIFNVIQPIEVVRGVKYAISDSLDDKTQRLIKKAAEILGGLDVE